MIVHTRLILIAVTLFVAACSGPDPDPRQDAPSTDAAPDSQVRDTDGAADDEVTEIAPGLTRRTIQEGDGATAQPGQVAVVHYTGWLFDESATDNRGQKFDSSRDRDQYFEFPLGAGRVISGWDQGVVGMEVGEIRELTIAPDLAYGARGAGDLIPPDSTLIFEVELVDLKDPT